MSKSNIFTFYFFLVSSLVLPALHAEEPVMKSFGSVRFSVDSWNIDNGLPQNTVKSLIQTADGYIWFGTSGGLVRFNGVSFKVFNSTNTPQMASDRVLTLAEDREGRLWIGLEGGGLMTYLRGTFNTYEHLRELDKKTVLKIFTDAAGVIWVYSLPELITRISGNDVQYFRGMNGLAKGSGMIRDNNGTIYASTDKECFQFTGGSFVPMKLNEVIGTDLAIAPYWDRSGNLWTCRKGGYLSRTSSSGTMRFTSSDGLLSTFIRSIYQDKDGAVWIGSDAGLNIFDGKDFHTFTINDGLKGNEIISILEDTESNIWLGTRTSGLMRIRKKVIATYRRTSLDAINNVTSVFGSNGGTVLFGVNCAGVNIIDKWGNVKNSIPISQLENGCIWSIFVDSKNTLWLGTWGGGLLRYPKFDPAKNISGIIKKFSQISADVVLATMESRDGTMWFGSLNEGLFRYRNDSIVRIAMDGGGKNYEVRSICEGHDGKIRIGTGKGLYSIPTTGDSVCTAEKNIPSVTIRALYEDDDSVLWVGTYGKGLFRLVNGASVNYRQGQGFYDDLVSHILEDGSGWLWMGCNKGIFSVNKNQLNRIAAGAKEEVISTSFSTAEGMMNRETNGGFQPSAYKSDDGRLWFPTVNGVAVILPDDVKRNPIAPPVVIEQIHVDRQQRSLDTTLTVTETERIVEFDYTALSFSAPEKLRFKYMMEGFDDQWHDAGNKREAVYMNIPPGSYNFNVIAANNDGVWNTVGAAIPVVILPPFWQSLWFKLLIGFVLIVAGPSFYVLRVKALEQKAKMQELFSRQLITSQEQERKKIAGEIHDSLSQNILLIKHRAQLALELISDPSRLIDQVNEISVLASETLEDTRKISQELRPSHLDRLGLTLTLKYLMDNIANATTLTVEREINHVDGLLAKDDEIMVYRILQELINNVLKHAAATTLTVIVGIEESQFRIFVQDDGKGFDPDVVRVSKTAGGLGLTGITERINLLNGTYSPISSPGKGTTFNILLPIQSKVL
jgi:signal transduction histidine kinase/ligand-binding sensor domain-containing protein